MSTRLRVLSGAADDIARAARWYDEQREGLGADFGRELDRVLERLERLPLTAPVWMVDRRFRRVHLRRFPFSVFVRVAGSVLSVVAVAHHKQRPDHWLGR